MKNKIELALARNSKILENLENTIVYNYHASVFFALKYYILENIEEWYFEEFEELREIILEKAWASDQVTGNASGSYTFSRFTAERYLLGNNELYIDALEEFGGDFQKEPEHRDIAIRCHLLHQVIDEVLEDEEIKQAIQKGKED